MERDQGPSLFGSFFGYFIAHSTIANLVLVVVVVLGFFSINKLRSQFFPDVIIETINISAYWPGAGAEDLDTGVVGYLEPSLLELEGIERIVSRSYEGVSRITIDFVSNWDMEKALDDVKIAIEEAENLPDELDDIDVKRRVWRDRVTNVVFSGPFTIEAVPSVRVKNSNSKINENENEQEIENYINEIYSTGIQTIEGKKIKFLNLEKTKGFQYIHAIGQIEYENSNRTTYVSFGPSHGPLEQTQVENAFYELRENLNKNTIYFRSNMESLGFDILPGSHPIVPIMLYDAKIAQLFSQKLLKEGIYVVGFFYPVVPRKMARIRVQLSASHTIEQLDFALSMFSKVGKELKIIS